MAWYICPSCGEQVDTEPDAGAGDTLEYVEDCPVCCRPLIIRAHFDEQTNDYVVDVRRE